MDDSAAIVDQKTMAAIKLAKNLESFSYKLGPEYDPVYIETLTEDIKQQAREVKKLAKVVAPVTAHLLVRVDGEDERVTKLMRRYSTRIQDMADLIYEVAHLNFEELQQQELDAMMAVEGEEDEDE